MFEDFFVHGHYNQIKNLFETQKKSSLKKRFCCQYPLNIYLAYDTRFPQRNLIRAISIPSEIEEISLKVEIIINEQMPGYYLVFYTIGIGSFQRGAFKDTYYKNRKLVPSSDT